MIRYSKFVLIAIMVITATMHTASARQVTNGQIYDSLEVNGEFVVANGDTFPNVGNVEFPPNLGAPRNDLDDGIYTLRFPSNVTARFYGHLTITETAYLGGNVGIGRIQVLGEAGDMVTMDEADGAWNGIIILTDPSDPEELVWQTRFEEGNYIHFCNILNASGGAAAVVIGSGGVNDAQAWVKSCYFDDPEDNYRGISVPNQGLYALQGNYFDGEVRNYAIACQGSLTDDAGNFDPNTLLEQVISQNVVSNVNTENEQDWGIQVWGNWNGTITNNIVLNVDGDGIEVDGSVEASILNNTVVSCVIGIDVADVNAWCTVANNLIDGCTDTGISGTNAADEVDYCLFNNNAADFENCIEGAGDVFDDPEFFGGDPYSYQLGPTSPAIDAGTGTMDLNFTPPDIGAYGGPYASEAMKTRLFGAVVEGTHHFETYGEVPEDYTYTVPQETILEFDAGYGLSAAGDLICEGGFALPVTISGFEDAEWTGVYITGESNSSFEYTEISGSAATGIDFSYANVPFMQNCIINDNALQGVFAGESENPNTNAIDACEIYGNGDDGIYLLDCEVSISDCDIHDNDGYGIYANAVEMDLTNSTVSDSYCGVYLVDCIFGDVLIDNCDITGNGFDGTYLSAGVYLSNSSPEIINSTIQGNSGCGIALSGSVPDLNTYYGGNDHPNTITQNGTAPQSGSNGCEIYVASSSYPDIRYNNIYDYNLGVVGIMIYKSTSASSGLTAENNYWGYYLGPSDNWFYWGLLDSPIDYSPAELILLSSFEDYAAGVAAWEAGEYETAARYFAECISDTGANGVNSVHYLTGCYNKLGWDFGDLRGLLQEASAESESEEVAKVAGRYATHCLTLKGEYEDAVAEYDGVREEAGCLEDSVNAALDILAVQELANCNRLDGLTADIQAQRGALMQMLQDRGSETATNLPKEFAILNAYPNPFNSTVRLSYSLPEAGNVKVSIVDVQGREVAVLRNGMQEAGSYVDAWDGQAAPSGIYYVRLQAGGRNSVLKLAMVK